VFGPSAAAARLEASKGFARAFNGAPRIPQPRFARFEALADARPTCGPTAGRAS